MWMWNRHRGIQPFQSALEGPWLDRSNHGVLGTLGSCYSAGSGVHHDISSASHCLKRLQVSIHTNTY